MYDIFLEWGADLAAGSNGDLALATGSVQTNQRVLRRLLTSPCDYIWNLNYGGGLGSFVGSASSSVAIEAVIRAQMLLEPAVASVPAPTVEVQTLDSTTGYVVADITYADASSGSLANLNVVSS